MSRARQAKLWFTLLAASALAAACSPQVPTGQPAAPITVRGPDGGPVGGATVILADMTGATTAVTTSVDGQASLPDDGRTFVVSSADAVGFKVSTRRQAGGSFVLEIDSDTSDADADGLSASEEAAVGTDPANPDSDADGLSDGAEARVVEGFAPIAMDASPRHRDLFLEVDWWSGLGDNGRPTQLETDTLQAAFFDSPVVNPDGSHGITLHVDTGRFGGGTPITLDEMPSCWEPDFYENVAPERRNTFFHAFVAPTKQYCGYSGLAYARRSVVVNDTSNLAPQIGDVFDGGTTAHELGHTLGLRHGGFEDLNCKPNYPSIMNYDNLPMILNGHLSFSRGKELPIDEAAVDETQQFLIYGGYDFDHDGTIDQTPYAADMTNGKWVDPVIAQIYNSVSGFDPDVRCPSDGAATTVLRDHDDWSTIVANLPKAVGTPVGEGSWNPADQSAWAVL